MNRFKFKGRRLINNQWIEGSLSHDGNMAFINEHDGFKGWQQVDPDTVSMVMGDELIEVTTRARKEAHGEITRSVFHWLDRQGLDWETKTRIKAAFVQDFKMPQEFSEMMTNPEKYQWKG